MATGVGDSAGDGVGVGPDHAPLNKGVVYLYDRLNKGVATGVGDSAVYGPTNKEVMTPYDPFTREACPP